jgi:glycosyltransferase involved in cell wall biosynthesis
MFNGLESTVAVTPLGNVAAAATRASAARRSGAGFVVPPGDTDATTEALAALLADETLRRDMGARGRAWHEQYLGMQRSIEKWVNVIETAVAEKAGSGD